MEMMQKSNVRTLIWDGIALSLIDQRKLPFEEKYVKCSSSGSISKAIKDMVVRGAPAIGVTAAYGAVLAAKEYNGNNLSCFLSSTYKKFKNIAQSRPTAVNLSWALDRMKAVIDRADKDDSIDSQSAAIKKITAMLEEEAKKIEREDVEINKRLGDNALKFFSGYKTSLKVLTHCNAGALATAGYGTAMGVIRSLNNAGLIENVIVDETRPYLQGARLTAWELYKEKIPFFVITDNMSGYFMSKGEVDAVVVGADRIAANGDTANKIGTLSLSIIAKYYNIPFLVAAPISTIDLKTPEGSLIPIEQRPAAEVREISGNTIIPDYMPVLNPAFDVTPNENITGVITEKGIADAPYEKNLKKLIKI